MQASTRADEAAVGAMNRPLRAVPWHVVWYTYLHGARRGRFIAPTAASSARVPYPNDI
ncbi:MAG TPA: hypothetical protein VJ761_19980 [Ktedonobacteraceae bacterium]|nr:hypothetical protein [Ktedonobacteraceae bacterium]